MRRAARLRALAPALTPALTPALALALTPPAARAQELPAAEDACAIPARVAAADLPAPDPQLAQLRRFATGAGVRVAVIDTGVAPNPELRRLTPGIDLVNPEAPDPFFDCDSHGTVVAGVIAGATRGVAPDAEILSIRQTSMRARQPGNFPGGAGSLQTLADAIHFALDQRARVINVSVVSCLPPQLAGRVDMGPIRAALARAEAEGALVVAAAGNASESCEPGYTVVPAHEPTVLAVAARDGDHNIAAYSLPVPGPSVSAPGLVEAALASNGSGWASGTAGATGREDHKNTVQPYVGTSFAAPAISGAAALLIQRYPHLSPAQLRTLIHAAAQPGGAAVEPLAAVEQLPPAAIAPRQLAVGTEPARESAAPARWLRLAAGLALLAACGAFASRRP